MDLENTHMTSARMPLKQLLATLDAVSMQKLGLDQPLPECLRLEPEMAPLLLRPPNLFDAFYPTTPVLEIVRGILGAEPDELVLEPFASSGLWSALLRSSLRNSASDYTFRLVSSEHYRASSTVRTYAQLFNEDSDLIVQRMSGAGILLLLNMPGIESDKKPKYHPVRRAVERFRGRYVLYVRSECQPYLGEPGFHVLMAKRWTSVYSTNLTDLRGRKLELVLALRNSIATPIELEMTRLAWSRRHALRSYLAAIRKTVLTEMMQLTVLSADEIYHHLELDIKLMQESRAVESNSGSSSSSEESTEEELEHSYFGKKHAQVKAWIIEGKLRLKYGEVLPRYSDLERLKGFVGTAPVLQVNAGLGLWSRLLGELGLAVSATDSANFDRMGVSTYARVLCCENGAAVLSHPGCTVLLNLDIAVDPATLQEALVGFEGSKLICTQTTGTEQSTAAMDLHNFIWQHWTLVDSWPALRATLGTKETTLLCCYTRREAVKENTR